MAAYETTATLKACAHTTGLTASKGSPRASGSSVRFVSIGAATATVDELRELRTDERPARADVGPLRRVDASLAVRPGPGGVENQKAQQLRNDPDQQQRQADGQVDQAGAGRPEALAFGAGNDKKAEQGGHRSRRIGRAGGEPGQLWRFTHVSFFPQRRAPWALGFCYSSACVKFYLANCRFRKPDDCCLAEGVKER